MCGLNSATISVTAARPMAVIARKGHQRSDRKHSQPKIKRQTPFATLAARYITPASRIRTKVMTMSAQFTISTAAAKRSTRPPWNQAAA